MSKAAPAMPPNEARSRGPLSPASAPRSASRIARTSPLGSNGNRTSDQSPTEFSSAISSYSIDGKFYRRAGRMLCPHRSPLTPHLLSSFAPRAIASTAMPDDPYAVDAAYYDAIHGSFRDDIGLWLSFAGRTDRPVLEVGCGTG